MLSKELWRTWVVNVCVKGGALEHMSTYICVEREALEHMKRKDLEVLGIIPRAFHVDFENNL